MKIAKHVSDSKKEEEEGGFFEVVLVDLPAVFLCENLDQHCSTLLLKIRGGDQNNHQRTLSLELLFIWLGGQSKIITGI